MNLNLKLFKNQIIEAYVHCLKIKSKKNILFLNHYYSTKIYENGERSLPYNPFVIFNLKYFFKLSKQF